MVRRTVCAALAMGAIVALFASGTALIRPDFPELKDYPYLWQQAEYVLGGGATHFMFLVLAADQLLQAEQK